MCHRTLAIYCFIDDLLKSFEHHEDSRTEVSDAEVVTTALVAMLYFGGNFERARLILHEIGLIKRLLSRSRLNRRIHRLADLIGLVFHQSGSVIKDLNWESRYLLDSFPMAVCDNIRIDRCRIVTGENYRGYQASKRRYFYGVRVQVVTTADGIPVEFAILPGKFADIDGLAHLALDLPPETHLIADSAYTNYEWEDYLLEKEQINFLVQRKRQYAAQYRTASGRLQNTLPQANRNRFWRVDEIVSEKDSRHFFKRLSIKNLVVFVCLSN